MLGFSTFRRVIIHARGRRLAIWQPARTKEVETEWPITAICPLRDATLFTTTARDGADSTLWRIRDDEAAPRRLAELAHGASRINPSPSGDEVAVLGTRTTLLAIRDDVAVEVARGEAECAVALGGGEWVSLRNSMIHRHEPGGGCERLAGLQREGTFVFAEAMGEAAGITFVQNQASHSLVQHVNARTRASSPGLLVPLATWVRVARRRRTVLLWSISTAQMFLLDLRNGRLIARRAIPADIVDVDLDAGGDEAVVESSDGRLSVMSVKDLLTGAGTPGEIPPSGAAVSEAPSLAPPEPVSGQVGLAAEADTVLALDAEAAVALHDLPVPAGLASPRRIAVGLAELFLERAFELVAALCQRGIASAWNTGRLAYHAQSELPYDAEVAALLRRNQPRAETKLLEAEVALREAARVCEFFWHAGLVPSGDDMVVADRSAADPPPEPIDWPLRTLALDFELSPVACDILLVLLAPSFRPEFARLYAILRNDPARVLCDEMLLCQLLEPRSPAIAIAAELEDDAPLVRHGLVRRGAGERIFAALTVDPAVMSRMRAMPPRASGEAEPGAPPGGFWIAKDAVAGVQRALRDAEAPLRLLLRGRRSAGRRTLAAMIARSADRATVNVDIHSVARKDVIAWLRGILIRTAILQQVPCVSGLDAPDLEAETRTALLNMVAAYPGPLFLRSEPDWTPGAELRFSTIDLPRLSETGRRQVWQRRLAQVELIDGSAIDTLATRHAAGPGSIISVSERLNQALPTAEILAKIEARLADARESRMGTLATRIRQLTRWEDVILPEDVSQRIQELTARIRFRRQVYETWGFQNVATTALGITALFQGGPGTGKTLVAGAIARELDYDLYRVDVSKIVSKWIGETEKNLGAIFDSAEDGRLVLLFDEADTLFGKRTEVKSSVDRYANSEVNFLLQRLDTFGGLAILTTNRPGAMDPAFQRRLSMAVQFPEPDDDLRERIWEVHIPQAVPRDPDLDLEAIARAHQFSGGHIRNSVMRALFFAASDGTPLRQWHLIEAIRLEYQNLGKLAQGGAIEA